MNNQHDVSFYVSGTKYGPLSQTEVLKYELDFLKRYLKEHDIYGSYVSIISDMYKYLPYKTLSLGEYLKRPFDRVGDTRLFFTWATEIDVIFAHRTKYHLRLQDEFRKFVRQKTIKIGKGSKDCHILISYPFGMITRIQFR